MTLLMDKCPMIMNLKRLSGGNCTNTYNEERKQFVYAEHMGIELIRDVDGAPVALKRPANRILDIGGGPVSMLLKCDGLGYGAVVNPIDYPGWTKTRYFAAGIQPYVARGEDIHELELGLFDEVWIYNCLQHVDNPSAILKNAMAHAPTVRLFEWIDIPAHAGHPHMITEKFIDEAFGHRAIIKVMHHHGRSGCYGRAITAVYHS